MSRFLKRFLKNSKKFLTRRRELVFISDDKIVNKKIGALSTLAFTFSFLWVAFASSQYFAQLAVIKYKQQEIKNLRAINTYLGERVEYFNNNLSSVNDYLKDINAYDHFDTVDIDNVLSNTSQSTIQEEVKLSDDDVQIMLSILDTDNIVGEINKSINQRAYGLENIISTSGLSLRNVEELDVSSKGGLLAFSESNEFLGQGGPFYAKHEANKIVEHDDVLKVSATSGDFNDKVEYLSYVEKLVNTIPLSKPMKHRYRTTSTYGFRRDPFKGTKAFHSGLDFAGPIRAKIYSTSSGRVIFAGYKGAYGKYVEIDHGMGVKTTYGHMAKILVKKGDMIERGQVVGLQGNTGRSTGDHLHYEVRYNNKTYNPRYFLDSGEKLF